MHDHCHTTVRQRGNRLLRFTFVFFCLLAWSGWCHADDSQSKAALSQGERLSKVDQSFRKLSLALHYFHDRQGYFSPSIEEHPDYYDAQGCLKVSWRVHLLPFLEQKKLYEQFKLNEPWDSPHNAPLAKQMPAVFRSPDSPLHTNRTRFRGFAGTWITNVEGEQVPTSLFAAGRPVRIRDISDGTSYTLQILETDPQQAVVWTNPEELSSEKPIEAAGKPSHGRMALFCDGRRRLLNPEAGNQIWRELIGPADGTQPDLERVAPGFVRPLPDPGPLTPEMQQKHKERLRRMQTMNQLRYIGIAMINHAAIHDRLPPTEKHLVNGKATLSWRVHLLPYLGQQQLYNEFHLNEPWDSPHNKSLVNKIPDDYKSQGVKQKGYTTCMTFSGTGTPFPDGPGPRLQDFKDGISDTILLVSAGPTKAVPWTKPVDLPLDVKNPARVLGLKSDDSLIIILADGSVKSIPLTISPETLKHLIQPDDGNKIEWPKRK